MGMQAMGRTMLAAAMAVSLLALKPNAAISDAGKLVAHFHVCRSAVLVQLGRRQRAIDSPSSPD